MGTLSNPFLPYAAAIATALLGKPTFRSSSELRWGRKNSLVVNIAGYRAGHFHDFSTREHGDLIDLVQRELQLDRAAALEWLRSFTGRVQPVVYAAAGSQGARHVWSEKARVIWESTIPLSGTLGESYLRSRKCYVPNTSDLRFSNGTDKYPPSLVARVTDFQTGQPMTLHFIRLDRNTGSKASGSGSKFLLSGHRSQGGVVRLSPAVPVGGRLHIAEGIETALSVMTMQNCPVWAALSASNLAHLAPSNRHGELLIWADNDRAGIDAADTLATRWRQCGHSVHVEMPPDADSDWNDFAMNNAKWGRK